MDIKIKLLCVLNVERGVSKDGIEWKSVIFVGLPQPANEYTKPVAFKATMDRVDEVINREPGDILTVHFNIQSREFNGRYYTDVIAWKIEAEAAAAAPAAPAAQKPAVQPAPANSAVVEDNTMLPF